MARDDKVKLLLVDDQPSKLLSYEVILDQLGESLIKASSARAALEQLLKNDIALVLIDVCMPELDGFELASMIREHPRFAKIPLIFISAIHLTELDRLRGYECGAVDYIPVPVIPEILRAKVKVFVDLYRKTRELEHLNAELEARVAERTAALEASSARLRASEERLRLAQEARGIVPWEWDPAQSLLWSEGLADLLGLCIDEWEYPTRTWLDAIHPEDRGRVEGQLGRAIRDGGRFESQYRIVRPDCGERWLESCGNIVNGDPARPLRLVGVTYDVTEQRRASEALERLNLELEHRVEERTAQLVQLQKTEALGQLTGGVAHDFNNLLAAIQWSLEPLKTRLADDPRATRSLDCAIQGVERGAALTRRMLAFARGQDLKPVIVKIPELVSGMADLLVRSLGPMVTIETEFPATLGPALADRHQLELAILNLAVNSRDAMPEGGRILIRAEDETIGPDDRHGLSPGRYLRLSVADTGSGMDHTTLTRATEPFFTTKEVGKGTGLGLSMVHGLAVQSGGTMHIASKLGEGTEVTVWLPQAESSPAAGTEEALSSRAAADTLAILVVDDDTLVRTGLVGMIEDLGHRVTEASSGSEALALLGEGQDFDLVISDYAMPGLTGYQLIVQIENLYPDLPAILATGYAELPAGAEALPRLLKPFGQDSLARMISTVLEEPNRIGA